MDLIYRIICLATFLIFVSIISGCFVNFNNESLDEYGRKVGLTMVTLVNYIGTSKDDVRRDFGEPTEIRHESGMIATHYKVEKVPFDELWYYIYRKGIPGINAEGSTKRFFFKSGKSCIC